MPIPVGITIGWPSTHASIPSGWERVTALDGIHPKAIPDNSTNPGGTGGAEQHSHTTANHDHTIAHTHASATSEQASGTASAGTSSGAVASTTHTHASNVIPSTTDSSSEANPSSSSVNNDPARWDTIWIESDGTPTTIPSGAITFWNDTTLPASWTRPDNGKDAFLRGAATGSGNGGGTGGGSSHTHSGSGSHTHTSAHVHPNGTSGNNSASTNNRRGTGSTNAISTHTHTITVASGDFGTSVAGDLGAGNAVTPEPPWIKEAIIQAPGGDYPVGIIALWMGTLASIPDGWTLCDGTGGTPNLCQGKFIKGAGATINQIGDTGGNTEHGHTTSNHTHTWSSSAHTHTLSYSVGVTAAGGTGNTLSGVNHTHAAAASGAISGGGGALVVGNASPILIDTSHIPPWCEVAFIQFLGEINNYEIDAATGVYSVSGVVSGTLAGRVINAEFSSYTVSGVASSLLGGFSLDAAIGSYTVSGVEADLVAVVLGQFSLDAESGVYVVSGASAATLADRVLDASPGVHTLVGFNASTVAGYLLNAGLGNYGLSGEIAAILAGRLVSAEIGGYNISGVSAGLLGGFTLQTNIGVYSVAGFNADLIAATVGQFSLDAESGGYSLSGVNATLAAGKIMTADAATYIISGTDASLVAQRILSASPDSYVLTGEAIGIILNRIMPVDPGIYVVIGAAAKAVLEIDTMQVGGLSLQEIRDAMTLAPTLVPVADSIDTKLDSIAIASAGTPLSKRAYAFAILGGNGTVISGTFSDTFDLNTVYHQISPVATIIECAYDFDIGLDYLPLSVTFIGRLSNPAASIGVYSFRWADSTWNQIGTLAGKNQDGTTSFTLFAGSVGTGDDVGQVRIRFFGSGLTPDLYVDQLFVSYTTATAFNSLDRQILTAALSLPQFLALK
jgi:hypothetical protein